MGTIVKAGERRAGSATSGISDERDQRRAGSATSGISDERDQRRAGSATSGILDRKGKGRRPLLFPPRPACRQPAFSMTAPQAAFTRQTKIGKLKLVCVNGTRNVGKHVGKQLATNRTCLYSRQLFHQLFRVGKLVSDM